MAAPMTKHPGAAAADERRGELSETALVLRQRRGTGAHQFIHARGSPPVVARSYPAGLDLSRWPSLPAPRPDPPADAQEARVSHQLALGLGAKRGEGGADSLPGLSCTTPEQLRPSYGRTVNPQDVPASPPRTHKMLWSSA